jgi:hypothetical protein
MSCAKWNLETGVDQELSRWWLMGFVSGASRERSVRNLATASSDPDGLSQWVKKYCDDHPLDSPIQGAVALVDELARKAR